MRVGGSLGELVPPGNAMLTVAGAVAGHAVGMNMNRREGVRVGDANSSGNVINVSHSTAEAASN